MAEQTTSETTGGTNIGTTGDVANGATGESAAQAKPESTNEQRLRLISGVVATLVSDLTQGTGDKDRRRQVEEWLRTLAEKYPEFKIENGLRDYYLAEAERLRADFDKTQELSEKLSLARAIEGFLERATDYERRISER